MALKKTNDYPKFRRKGYRNLAGHSLYIGNFCFEVEQHGVNLSYIKKTPHIWFLCHAFKLYCDSETISEKPVDLMFYGILWCNSKKNINTSIEQIKRAFDLDLTYKQLNMLNSTILIGRRFDGSVYHYVDSEGRPQYQINVFYKQGESPKIIRQLRGKDLYNRWQPIINSIMEKPDTEEEKKENELNQKKSDYELYVRGTGEA